MLKVNNRQLRQSLRKLEVILFAHGVLNTRGVRLQLPSPPGALRSLGGSAACRDSGLGLCPRLSGTLRGSWHKT